MSDIGRSLPPRTPKITRLEGQLQFRQQTGRASQSEYWWFYLVGVVNGLLILLLSSVSESLAVVALIVAVVSIPLISQP